MLNETVLNMYLPGGGGVASVTPNPDGLIAEIDGLKIYALRTEQGTTIFYAVSRNPFWATWIIEL
jgi:hypothetical protein